MKLTIEYTDGFEKFRTEIGGEQDSHTEMDTIRKSIKCLEEQCNSLSRELSEIKELLSQKEPIDGVESTDIVRTYKNSGHISTYKHFDNYCLPRKYDAEKQRFFASENRPSIKLGFIQLVAIIKAYQNGLSVKKMRTNPILAEYSIFTLQHYIYIWRAGGFNQAIKDNARKFGYNPEKLLSKEMEE